MQTGYPSQLIYRQIEDLSKDHLKTMVNGAAFFMSRSDYCKSLYCYIRGK